ncbi:N-6 DNA methylase [Acinetobacter lwoffii]|uniref:N-6 DNA methylase n=1 Tax=Acinetobacter lwoffii TaxID=28090 RepID=UPI003B970625
MDEDSTNTLRDRSNEVLFIDARNCGEIYQKKFIQIVEKDIELISNIYSNWKYKHLYTNYQDIDELCYSANIDEIQKKNFSLVPSNYIKFNERDIFNDIEDNLDSYKKNILSSLENDIKINQNLINTILGESNK